MRGAATDCWKTDRFRWGIHSICNGEGTRDKIERMNDIGTATPKKLSVTPLYL
jgi:hypothetical protein